MRRMGIAIGCGMVILSIIAIATGVCAPVGNELSKSYWVTYDVTGSAWTVDITYTNGDGGTSQLSGVMLPWRTSFSAGTLSFVYVAAQNQGETGTVTVTIYRDGEEFKTTTSYGAYVIASAHGSL